MIKEIILVGLGGGAGSILRYLVSWVMGRWAVFGFPAATFLVNVVGCLLIGLLSGVAVRGGGLPTDVRLLLVAGFCGGFTTFSAFSQENVQLFQSGQYLSLALYVSASMVCGFLAVVVGLLITK
jgi:CrcB protein